MYSQPFRPQKTCLLFFRNASLSMTNAKTQKANKLPKMLQARWLNYQ